MKKIIIPLRTYHNVRGPVLKTVGDADFEVLLDQDFVDITSENWKQTIIQKLEKLKSNNCTLFFVVTGHPIVNIFIFNEAKKLFNEVKMLFWDSSRKKYHLIVFN